MGKKNLPWFILLFKRNQLQKALCNNDKCSAMQVKPQKVIYPGLRNWDWRVGCSRRDNSFIYHSWEWNCFVLWDSTSLNKVCNIKLIRRWKKYIIMMHPGAKVQIETKPVNIWRTTFLRLAFPPWSVFSQHGYKDLTSLGDMHFAKLTNLLQQEKSHRCLVVSDRSAQVHAKNCLI